MKTSNSWRLSGLILLATALFASGQSWALEGTVILEETKAPMAGVYVVVEWIGAYITPVQQQSGCYHSAITKTDADGRYKIAEFNGLLPLGMTPDRRSIRAYAPGYERVPIGTQNYLLGTAPKERTDFVLRPWAGSKSSRFHDVINFPTGESCGLPAELRRELELATFGEARELATSPGEQRTIQFFQKDLGVQEVKPDSGGNRSTVPDKTETTPSKAMLPK